MPLLDVYCCFVDSDYLWRERGRHSGIPRGVVVDLLKTGCGAAAYLLVNIIAWVVASFAPSAASIDLILAGSQCMYI
jgi:hypothetical protein